MSAAAAAILALLAERDAGATICPSEAARRLDAVDWRSRMPEVHQAARALEREGRIVGKQRGLTIDLDCVRGAYRLALAAKR